MFDLRNRTLDTYLGGYPSEKRGTGERGQSPFISLLCVVIMFDLRNRTLDTYLGGYTSGESFRDHTLRIGSGRVQYAWRLLQTGKRGQSPFISLLCVVISLTCASRRSESARGACSMRGGFCKRSIRRGCARCRAGRRSTRRIPRGLLPKAQSARVR